MGIASMIIGIIAVIIAFIPCVGGIAFLPAIVGLVLGIVDVVQSRKKELPAGKGIAGIVCNAVAIVVIILWSVIFVGASVARSSSFSEAVREAAEKATQEIEREAATKER